MEILMDDRPLYAVLVSLLAVPMIVWSGDRENLREVWTFAAAIFKLALVLSIAAVVSKGSLVVAHPIPLVHGFKLELVADPLGVIFALLASSLWIVTSIYSVGYMRAGKYQHQTGYFAFFAICLSATLGIAFAGNLITFFIFYEILTVATYPLVIHNRDQESVLGGRKYLIYTFIAGQCFLAAIVATGYLADGNLSFSPGGILATRLPGGEYMLPGNPTILRLVFVLFMIGVGVKAAIMPLHGWLPSAMVAPTPVSSLLHAVAVVKAGAFGCLRIVGFIYGVGLMEELGLNDFLAAFAVVTIIVGSLRALGSQNLKQRLAFSTVSQLSYIVLGAAIGSKDALIGAIFHVVAHGFMKITLFFCAGSIYTRYHTYHIPRLRGMGRKMPVTFAAFTIGACGIAGMPLVAGFLSKWNLALGAIHADRTILVAVLVLSSLLNVAYFFPIIRDAFLESDDPVSFEECWWPVWIPPVITACCAVILGLNPNAFVGFFNLAELAAHGIVFGGG